MCFYLEGKEIGTQFKLNYEIIGKNSENVKFYIWCKTDNEEVMTIEK